ncbi:MAG TPA: efflux RND transporter periplasmic adaptor subunit [Burkholderiaceae bacterium]|nr:efflux RND transporter periplasmic adaptor subunit [Burkholderiaceae bacterium]
MPPARLAFPLLAAASAVLFMAACSRQPVATEDVRPVRTLTISPRSTNAVAEFAGEVRPRIETRAGFQVGGRMTQRLVEVGQAVKQGQPLATIDPQDYRLAAEASEAARTSAQVDRDQQRADYKRFEDLQAKGFISQAELDRRKASLDAAEARYAQTVAAARQTGNQAAYSVLRAPHDAVVTVIDAEVGQVVAAGQSVIRLAQTGEKEVLIGIPEQQLALLKAASDITVRLWVGGAPIKGKVREVSPVADSATRTFPARISLLDPPVSVALGMTASVSFAIPLPQAVITVPLQALLVDGGATHTWRYDPTSSTVHRTRVSVGNVAGNEVVVSEGLKPGDIVVTAGAHQLKEGQRVKLLAGAGAPVVPAGDATVKPDSAKKG